MKKFTKNTKGNAAISFAIVLPLLLLIIFAVIEFGLYFIKDQTALNAIGAIGNGIQISPEDVTLQTKAIEYGGSFVNFDTSPNYFCAQAYADYEDTRDATCTEGWNTARPDLSDADEPYFVLLTARTEKFNVAFSNFLPDINRRAVITVGNVAVISDLLVQGDDLLPGNNCPGTNNGGFCGAVYNRAITFAEAYAEIPKVMVSLDIANSSGACGSSSDRDSSYATNVTTTGFTMHCASSPHSSPGQCADNEGKWLPAKCSYIAIGKKVLGD